jgi:Anti-anti-sigma regulatory factor (antagonist of anti-sigma factor)
VKTDRVDDVLIISLPARLDAAGIAAIEHELAEMMNQHRGKVLADMSEVNFVASLALRMLLTNLRAVQAYGGDLVCVICNPQIAEIFRKSRLIRCSRFIPTANLRSGVS